MSEEIDIDIEKIADEIRDIFKAKKQEVMGRRINMSPRHDNRAFWIRIATVVNELGACPSDYMTACFEAFQDPKRLYPQMLYGAWAERAYKDYTKNKLQSHDSSTDYDIETILVNSIKLLNNVTKSWDQAVFMPKILNENFPIPEWVRIVISQSNPDVLEKFGESAYEFLVSSPGHIKFLNEIGFDMNPLKKFYHQRLSDVRRKY